MDDLGLKSSLNLLQNKTSMDQLKSHPMNSVNSLTQSMTHLRRKSTISNCYSIFEESSSLQSSVASSPYPSDTESCSSTSSTMMRKRKKQGTTINQTKLFTWCYFKILVKSTLLCIKRILTVHRHPHPQFPFHSLAKCIFLIAGLVRSLISWRSESSG